MNIIMSGEATPSQIGAFLMGMRVKGETVDEIAAAVSIMRERMVPVEAPDGAVDIVGTGGDGAGTLNISTASGDRGRRRPGCRSPSTATARCHRNPAPPTCLQALGVKIDLTPEQICALHRAKPASASCSRRRTTRR